MSYYSRISMKLYTFLLLLSFTLYAQNPQVFAQLGDQIYNDITPLQTLSQEPSLQKLAGPIHGFTTSALKIKEMGYKIDNKEEGSDAKAYLISLRELSVERDALSLAVKSIFEEAITKGDEERVTVILKSGLVEQEAYTEELVTFYDEYCEEDNSSILGTLYLEYQLKNQPEVVVPVISAETLQKQKDQERIARMRAKERAKKARLENEVAQQKAIEEKKVLTEQKEALDL